MGKNTSVRTMLHKLHDYLLEQHLTNLTQDAYKPELILAVQDWLDSEGYPLRARFEFDSNKDIWLCLPVGNDYLDIVKITARNTRDRKTHKLSYKTLCFSGTCYNMKINSLIDRRQNGVTAAVDELLADLHKAGYSTPEELIEDIVVLRKKLVISQFIELRYKYNLSDEERETLHKLIDNQTTQD